MKNIFQVEFCRKKDNKTFFVEGRFIEGNVINVGDLFTILAYNGKEYDINFLVSNISMYNKSISFIDVGMTGRIFFNGEFKFDFENNFEIIS